LEADGVDHPDFAAEASPEQLIAAVAANTSAEADMPSHGSHEGAHPGAVSVRTATYEGHEIVIRTQYQIEVDGRPFSPHLNLDNAGRVHYHGLPTREFASLVDLVKKAIDTFPDDFAEPAPEPHDHPDHHGHHDHGMSEQKASDSPGGPHHPGHQHPISGGEGA
jgi:hypothetical protein